MGKRLMRFVVLQLSVNAPGSKHVKAEGITCLDFDANCSSAFNGLLEGKWEKSLQFNYSS